MVENVAEDCDDEKEDHSEKRTTIVWTLEEEVTSCVESQNKDETQTCTIIGVGEEM